jgi:hypothetical protein
LEFLSAFSTTVCFAGTVLLSGGNKLLAVCRACRAKSESMIVSVASLHDGHCERNHAMVVPAFCFQHPVLLAVRRRLLRLTNRRRWLEPDSEVD